MAKFRKKLVTVEAIQWFKNGDHPNDFDKEIIGFKDGKLYTWIGGEARAKDWEGQVVRRFRHPRVNRNDHCKRCGKIYRVHGWIEVDNLEEGHTVCPGDWVITGEEGKRFPCKSDIFESLYESC